MSHITWSWVAQVSCRYVRINGGRARKAGKPVERHETRGSPTAVSTSVLLPRA